MKHLTPALAVFLLMGCQTIDTAVVSTAKPVEVAEAEPKKETPKQPEVPTVFQTAKPVICAPPEVIKKGLKNNKYEKLFATWVSIIKGLRVVMLVDRDRQGGGKEPMGGNRMGVWAGGNFLMLGHSPKQHKPSFV